mmetsp:Transcript_18895/g.55926  ORF Transcript_18895/g.55926 Transcript_18895/m.55926 type:complete len:407 (-) Transcript_18895:17-1237(-)
MTARSATSRASGRPRKALSGVSAVGRSPCPSLAPAAAPSAAPPAVPLATDEEKLSSVLDHAPLALHEAPSAKEAAATPLARTELDACDLPSSSAARIRSAAGGSPSSKPSEESGSLSASASKMSHPEACASASKVAGAVTWTSLVLRSLLKVCAALSTNMSARSRLVALSASFRAAASFTSAASAASAETAVPTSSRSQKVSDSRSSISAGASSSSSVSALPGCGPGSGLSSAAASAPAAGSSGCVDESGAITAGVDDSPEAPFSLASPSDAADATGTDTESSRTSLKAEAPIRPEEPPAPSEKDVPPAPDIEARGRSATDALGSISAARLSPSPGASSRLRGVTSLPCESSTTTCALPAAPEALREALPLAEALRPRRLVSRELSRRDWLLFCRRDDSAERSLMA